MTMIGAEYDGSSHTQVVNNAKKQVSIPPFPTEIHDSAFTVKNINTYTER